MRDHSCYVFLLFALTLLKIFMPIFLRANIGSLFSCKISVWFWYQYLILGRMKCHTLSGLKSGDLCSHSSGGWIPGSRGRHDQLLGRTLPALQTPAFSALLIWPLLSECMLGAGGNLFLFLSLL